MKSKMNLEELFKNNFEKRSQNVPGNLWEGIENRLDSTANTVPDTNKIRLKKTVLVLSGLLFMIIAGVAIIPTFVINSEKDRSKSLTSVSDIKNNEPNNISLTKKETKQISIQTNPDNINPGISLKTDKDIPTVIFKNDTALDIPRIDKNENVSQIADNIVNTEPATTVTAFFAVESNSGCSPFNVNFKNLSKNADTYFWDFGNGESSVSGEPSMVYDIPGKYTVNLKATAGSTVIDYQTEIVVYESPLAGFEISKDEEIGAEEQVDFINNSVNATSYKWSFGDNTYSDEKNPKHTYTNKGVYDIKLIVKSKNNCKDSALIYDFVVKGSKYKIIKPSAFTPNTSGPTNENINNHSFDNDLFYIRFKTEVKEYRLRIINRQGTVVFDSYNPNMGWNGYFNGKLMPKGVYIWECNGKYSDGKGFYDYGSITLL